MKDIMQIEELGIFVLDSDEQHMEDLIMFGKGHNKFKPYQGAEAAKYVKGQDLAGLETAVVQNLQADGVKKLSVETIDGQLSVNGTYETGTRKK